MGRVRASFCRERRLNVGSLHDPGGKILFALPPPYKFENYHTNRFCTVTHHDEKQVPVKLSFLSVKSIFKKSTNQHEILPMLDASCRVRSQIISVVRKI
jgi:hypothetical protein